MLTGPTIVSCFNSPDGMGVCLRGAMTNAGLLPQTVVADTEEPTEAPQDVAVIAPAEAPEPEATVSPGPELAVTPPATTDVPDNLIGATFGLLRAEPDGSVVIAGSGTPGTEVEVYSNDALIGSATVEPSGDWVIVPDAPITPGGTEITLAEAGKEGRSAQSFVVVINDDKTSEPLVVASTPGAASDILQGLDRPAIDTQVATADPVTPPAPAAPETTTPAAPAAETPAEPAATAPAPVAPAADTAATPPAAPAETPAPAAEPTIVAADPAPATPPASAAPAVATVAPTIDAIEIEGDRTFFAGAADEGANVRLYVDDAYVADSTVSDGRWLVEGGNVLTKPTQRVRIDVLAPNSADVTARAEVDFRIEAPAEEAPTAVAQAPEPAATEPAPVAEAPAPVETPDVAVAEATPAVTPETATDAVPTLVAISVGGPDSERFAAGKAIIRRGDNLWTIARRVYGEGIRYTTIYEANTGQIRDPNRIYPGQVFDLPN
ncbi:MAG: LysM peptidoglycan-binding domain-containing protein [Candidatus Devosia phytovorans]|uniref:LysM peptidoglycan-binding domain-containing protein n=1 Tax=Candidatus Devosia phytovorans TaxID=3121372 RepID=A0AAJ6AYA0_9HYPH|nr:LysM peptidoglycan-binding domain-containing protein [Devosia sp.]WEK02707.1 MAG: LysM peptidoglycan-binding domain-containing protein [Devosia sp.]